MLTSPLFDDNSCFEQAAEDFPVEQVVAQFVVEAFDMAVFPRAARFNVDRLDLLFLEPINCSSILLVFRCTPALHEKCVYMMLPKISVITPSFNQAVYLEEAICSVLDQGYPNLEYIVIDGGSTDGSVDIIGKYEKHLAYWVSEPDGGEVRGLDKGFRRSTGEIMAWLNSDDKYLIVLSDFSIGKNSSTT